MLVKPTTSGPGKLVRFKRRQVRRNPRRPLEAVQQDFNRWDQAAAVLGINWSEFARRALNEKTEAVERGSFASGVVGLGSRLSEKGTRKKRPAERTKTTATRAGRKG